MDEIVFSSNDIYIDQIVKAIGLKIGWDVVRNKTFLITGASGLIGMFLIDILMYANVIYALNIKIKAIGRDGEKAKKRFYDYFDKDSFSFISHDVNNPLTIENQCDYLIHGASNTHPIAYATDPIGTITANVIGTRNILEYAVQHKNQRVVFLSSVEIYGENRGDVDVFDESYCGYIDCNTLRAGYPESKRLGEALCQAYIHEKNLDVVIPRLSRVYGPTMSDSDSKAIAQFIKKAVNKEDIILKSKGDQLYSYTYVADAVTAILYILIYGKCGEAYNISDENSEITLRDLAETLGKMVGTAVIYEEPDISEVVGYSKATKALLCNNKLKSLGWNSRYNIIDGLEQTIKILKDK